MFEAIIRKGGIPCWISLYQDARRCGWKDEKIVTTIEQSLRDSGVNVCVEELIRRLRAYIQHQSR